MWLLVAVGNIGVAAHGPAACCAQMSEAAAALRNALDHMVDDLRASSVVNAMLPNNVRLVHRLEK